MTIADPDPTEFSAQFEAHRNMLRVHCYRMTGSFDDFFGA
jgi:DNA-directed RNA polymerase specialized sigma24 family protein